MELADVEKMRCRLRIKNVYKRQEIVSHMESAKLELARLGINAAYSEIMTFTAMELYTKYMMNYENAAERYNAAFHDLTSALALSSDYQITGE